jgi:hypothetical protein
MLHEIRDHDHIVCRKVTIRIENGPIMAKTAVHNARPLASRLVFVLSDITATTV